MWVPTGGRSTTTRRQGRKSHRQGGSVWGLQLHFITILGAGPKKTLWYPRVRPSTCALPNGPRQGGQCHWQLQCAAGGVPSATLRFGEDHLGGIPWEVPRCLRHLGRGFRYGYILPSFKFTICVTVLFLLVWKRSPLFFPKTNNTKQITKVFLKPKEITEGFTVQTWIFSSGRGGAFYGCWWIRGAEKHQIHGRVPKKSNPKYRRCWDDVFVFFFIFLIYIIVWHLVRFQRKPPRGPKKWKSPTTPFERPWSWKHGIQQVTSFWPEKKTWSESSHVTQIEKWVGGWLERCHPNNYTLGFQPPLKQWMLI